MTLDELITKHHIVLSSETYMWCNRAIEAMKDTIDPLHDDSHILRIFSYLDKLITEDKTLDIHSINFEALLLAICWHDLWKSTRFPSTLKAILFDKYWDGLGSAKVFRTNLKDEVDKKTYKKAHYAINVHSTPFFLMRLRKRSLEAKILSDLDSLDKWSMERTMAAAEKLMGKLDKRKMKLAKFFYEYFIKRGDKESGYFLDWTKQERLKMKNAFIKEADKQIKQYEYLIK